MAEIHNTSPTAKDAVAKHLAQAEPYGRPRRVWVEDGHVFVEGHDGVVVSMTPEVAIELGRLISNAGADSFVNKVMDQRDASSRKATPTA